LLHRHDGRRHTREGVAQCPGDCLRNGMRTGWRPGFCRARACSAMGIQQSVGC
jgi:hypothetical protein